MDQSSISKITATLAVVGFISPILFGYMLWRLQRIFISKERHEELLQPMREAIRELKEAVRELQQRARR